MSTKIYNAYRVKPGVYLWDLVRDFQKRGQQEAFKALEKFHDDLMKAVKPDCDEYKKEFEYYSGAPFNYVPGRADIIARSEVAGDLMLEEFRKQLGRYERNLFDFRVSITFREYKHRIYVQTYCDMMMRDVLDFVAKDRRITDFHYQNQTDMPKGVTVQAWRRRAQVWDGIYKEPLGRFQFLALPIIDTPDDVSSWLWDRKRELGKLIRKATA